MRRLAIVAHFDPLGGAADHVLRQLDALSRSFDHVIVATTASLTHDARARLRSRAELIERPNFGQDFASWRDGLAHTEFARGYDEVLLTNDSYVTVLDDFNRVIADMENRPVEFWGLTKSRRHVEHIQSYFLYFTKPAVDSKIFQNFWLDFRPARTRHEAITQQELGISRVLVEGGFRLGAYLQPTTRERLLANRRGVRWILSRRRTFASHDHHYDNFFSARRWRDPAESDNLNWATAFADFVFDQARLPIVKFDVLRYDPFWLDADELLRLCEIHYPTAFEGVRGYIEQTSSAYPGRPFENQSSAHLNPIQRAVYGYRRQLTRPGRHT